MLAHTFSSAASVRNYLSGVRHWHKQQSLPHDNMDNFHVTTLLRATDIFMRTTPHRMLPITPELLHKLCTLTLHWGRFGVVMRVALCFSYFGMLRQSNIAPHTVKQFDHARHTCRADMMFTKPGLALILKWSKASQLMDHLPVVPLPAVPGAPTCPVRAYRELLRLSPTRHPNQPLLSLPQSNGKLRVYTTSHLRKGLAQLLSSLQLDTGLYSLHSLRRGGATSSFDAGVSCAQIKRHGQWSSDAFWGYITSPAIALSPVAAALAQAAAAVH
jgi:hypothetical protein